MPETVAAVVMRSLQREPEARFAQAEDFGVALGEAAAAGWGADWLDHAEVQILGSQRLALAARTGPPTVAPIPGDEIGAAGVGGPAAPSPDAERMRRRSFRRS